MASRSWQELTKGRVRQRWLANEKGEWCTQQRQHRQFEFGLPHPFYGDLGHFDGLPWDVLARDADGGLRDGHRNFEALDDLGKDRVARLSGELVVRVPPVQEGVVSHVDEELRADCGRRSQKKGVQKKGIQKKGIQKKGVQKKGTLAAKVE